MTAVTVAMTVIVMVMAVVVVMIVRVVVSHARSVACQVGFRPKIDRAMMRRWICPVPSKMS